MAAPQLTDYELMRLEKIRQNKERLASLNLPSLSDRPSASSKRPKCVPRMVETNQQTKVLTRKGSRQKVATTTLHPESSTRTMLEDIPNETTDDDREEEMLVSETTKRKSRGPAKGSKGYGTKAQIFRKRIITTDAARSIWPLFKTELRGPYITYSNFPKEDLEQLFRKWRNKNFQFDCSEDALFDAFADYIKRNYKEWMSVIRNSVFDKHKSAAARYANNPSYVVPEIWTLMVDQWLKQEWQDVSEKNAVNRDKLAMVHTTGSVPMAKYIKEEIDKTGVEPSPIEMFRRFHISDAKEGKPEHWRSQKAKEYYESMELKKHLQEAGGGDGEEELDDWDIYKEVVVRAKGNKIRGLGDAMEPPKHVSDSSSQTCNQPSCLEREKEYGELKQEVGSLKAELGDLKQVMEALIAKVSPSLLAFPNSPIDGDSEGRGL